MQRRALHPQTRRGPLRAGHYPASLTERAELLRRGIKVAKGINDLRAGIAAVSARIENGTLKVFEGRCPNLLAEAELYCYSDDPRERHAEIPIDEHNHALAALRYLIMGIGPSRPRGSSSPDSPPAPQRPWLRYDNPALWTTLNW